MAASVFTEEDDLMREITVAVTHQASLLAV